MKLVISALLLGSATAYTVPTMAVAVKKTLAVKAPVKAASKVVKAAPKVVSSGSVPKGVKSEALPWLNAPYTLDGTVPGDSGFDPVGFTTTSTGAWWEGNAKGNLVGIKWFQEAELIHGRIAMLAVLGFFAPALIGHFPGNEWTGVDAYSYTNPLEAYEKVPGPAKFQISLFLIGMEFRRISIIESEGASYTPGDFKWGQGEGRWNPFGLNYSPEEYLVKQQQEISNGRLAMVAIFGLWAQAVRSGEGIVDQLSGALASPEYAAKAGYFFPEGI